MDYDSLRCDNGHSSRPPDEVWPFKCEIIAVSLAVLGSMALAAQDRFTLKVPNGPAFSDFRGYENWQNVAVSQTGCAAPAISYAGLL